MKIIKHFFHPGRRLPPIQTKQPPPAFVKKALLIGIQTVREDSTEVNEEHDNITKEEENAKGVPKRKKKKKREEKDKGARSKEATPLKGPHHDVLDMRQLLIGASCHDILFLLLNAFLLNRCLRLWS